MDALTTFDRIRPDDEFLDDEALERIWASIVDEPVRTTAPQDEVATALREAGHVVVTDPPGRRHRVPAAIVGIAASLALVVGGLTALQRTRHEPTTLEPTASPSSEGSPTTASPSPRVTPVGMVLPRLPDGLALVSPASPPALRTVPSQYQVRLYGALDDPTDPSRMIRLEYSETRGMAIPCHSFLSLPAEPIAHSPEEWRSAATPIAGSTAFPVADTTGSYCTDRSGVLQAGWFVGDLGVSLSAGSAATPGQLIAFASTLTMSATAEPSSDRPPADLTPEPLPADLVVLVGEDVPYAQRVAESSWVASPGGVDGATGQLVVQSWSGADEQGIFAKHSPIGAERVTVRGHPGYLYAAAPEFPLEVEVWWEEAPGLVLSVRSTDLLNAEALLALTNELVPATADEYASFLTSAASAGS